MSGARGRVALAAAALVAGVAGLTAFACNTRSSAPPPLSALPAPHGLTLSGFHGGPTRLGWNDDEPSLTPTSARNLSLAWASAPFAPATVAGTVFAPHLYASPLYIDDVTITSAGFNGVNTSVAIVATSNGDVYAVNAVASSGDAGTVAPGTILWNRHLGDPSQPERNIDGVPFGI